MDKLEFDARLAQLERRVSLLTALILSALVLIGVSAGFLLMVRTSVRPGSPSVASPRATVVHSAHAVLDNTDGSVGQIVHELRDLWELKEESLITGLDFMSKKEQLLNKPIRSTAIRPELEQLSKLKTQGVLNGLEYDSIKTKILEGGK